MSSSCFGKVFEFDSPDFRAPVPLLEPPPELSGRQHVPSVLSASNLAWNIRKNMPRVQSLHVFFQVLVPKPWFKTVRERFLEQVQHMFYFKINGLHIHDGHMANHKHESPSVCCFQCLSLLWQHGMPTNNSGQKLACQSISTEWNNVSMLSWNQPIQ